MYSTSIYLWISEKSQAEGYVFFQIFGITSDSRYNDYFTFLALELLYRTHFNTLHVFFFKQGLDLLYLLQKCMSYLTQETSM